MNLSRFHNRDLELDVVGAAVMKPGAFLESWDTGLRAEHMGFPSSAIIWDVAERLLAAGVQVDATSVLSEMSPGELQQVGRDRLFAYATETRYSHIDMPRKARRMIELAKIRQAFHRVWEMAEDTKHKPNARYVASELQALALELLAAEESHGPMTGPEAGQAARDRAREFAETGITFPRTGWPFYDRIIGGYRPGQCYGIVGHDKSGKTNVAMQILHHHSKQGRSGLYIGLETDAREMAERIHAWYDERIAYRTAQGLYDQKTVAMLEAVAQQHDSETAGIVYETDLAGDRRAIEAALVRGVHQHAIDLAVIDYINLIETRKYSKDNATMELYSLSRWLRTLAKRLRVPLIILSQYSDKAFSRDKKSKSPQIADVFGGGAMRKDCASITLMDNPFRFDETRPKHEAYFIVANNRFGPTGSIEMHRSKIGTYSEVGVVEGSLSA